MIQLISLHFVQGASSRPVQGARRLWRPFVAYLLLACSTAAAEELTQVESELVDPWPAAEVPVVAQEITTSPEPRAPQTVPSRQNLRNQLEVILVDEFEDPWGAPLDASIPQHLPPPPSEPWLE